MGKPKQLLYQLITPGEVFLAGQPYELLAEVRAESHFDTATAAVALAWKKGTKPDVDGRLVLGRCVRVTDLQRELIEYDFVIVLNREVWEDPEFDREKKLALLDHEMCHAARALDGDGEPMIDTKMRPVWRTRGRDIEEFRDIVARHGCWKRDLELFAQNLLKRQKSPLLAPLESAQASLADDPAFLDAADRLASSVRSGGVESLTISPAGMEPVVIDRPAAERTHICAVKAKKKAKRRLESFAPE
jgi:hypothetical protein